MIIKLGAAAFVSALGIGAVAVLGSGDAKHAPSLPAQASASSQSEASAPAAGLLPGRSLDCTLGRITNFDPSRVQKSSEYLYEGRHAFKLFLPSIPARTAPPPESTQPPEPVDPRTKIVADPDGLAHEAMGKPFGRVVDYWPERVEMITPISDVASNLIILSGADPAKGSVNIFMTKANDAVTFDMEHLYAGACTVTTTDGPMATGSHGSF